MRARCVLLLLLGALPALAGPAGPAFAARQQVALRARAGDAAALRCRVLRLGDRAVSWVRSSDLQILTHAGAVFTADSRVSCSEAPAGPDAPDAVDAPDTGELSFGDVLTSRDGGRPGAGAGSVHTLRIARLRAADAGRYECQVNTEPKMSLFFNLTVVESSLPVVVVRALGASTVRGALGGAAQLSCEARYEDAHGAALPPTAGLPDAALPALRLHWLHDGEPLDTQSARGGVSLSTERWPDGRLTARLTLGALRPADAGRYTCAADGAGAGEGGGGGGGARASAQLLLRVAPDDAPTAGELEAMQRDQAVPNAASAGRHSARALLLLLLPPVLLLT